MSLYSFVFVSVFVFVLVFDDEKKLWPDNQLKLAFYLTMMPIIVTMIVMITMIVTKIRMRILEPDYGLNLAPRVMRAPLFLTRSVFRSRSNNFEP